ncbi:MAG: UDP-N-acetylmuramoyl-L-alanyl-D-glutamate--2,6-diaminopimelate ligase [Rickettsiales bacterium]|nr:UDP-N-acetylmuramoyl-L-alanyl-D-glutamate--2,6-diaminopimelate ligase [Rickettsiales bacterium]
MHLSNLASAANLSIADSHADIEITGLCLDSRQCTPGNLFAALPGTAVDGQRFISDAIANGCSAILTSSPVDNLPENVACLVTPNPRQALGNMAATFYTPLPSHIAAVTGTNGKTSVAYFCQQLWNALGKTAASIGTIGIYKGNSALSDSALTTPDPITLYRTLSELQQQHITHIALEASSHGLNQQRLAGLPVTVAAFTNLSRDHLDYHKDMAAYLDAKMTLFSELLQPGGTAVLNADIPEYLQLHDVCEKRGIRVSSYGYNGETIRLDAIEPLDNGMSCTVTIDGRSHTFTLPLMGEFQALNVCCAIGMVMAEGVAGADILAACPQLHAVRGRMQQVAMTHTGASVIIDYAHTPDALSHALQALRPHCNGTLWVVFGCGGNRDAGKRPEMGKIAGEYADRVIVTDDSPRHENPAAIRAATLAACPQGKEIADRAEAIDYAVTHASEGDVILIAGKGHETYQLIGDTKHPFDDAEIAIQCVSCHA